MLGSISSKMNDLGDAGVTDQPLGVDFMDLNMIRAFGERGINWVDGMTPMMEARAIKSPNEQKTLQIVGSICNVTHYELSQWLKPGITENEVTAFTMEYLYNIPGMENVEDVIVSSGPNAWPNWRNHSDRIIRPGDMVIIDLAALTWNGFKSCVYRTYCVGGEPTDEHQQYYDLASKWLWDSIEMVRPGVTTADIASVWPSAKEIWGYEEEDEAAANLWGHSCRDRRRAGQRNQHGCLHRRAGAGRQHLGRRGPGPSQSSGQPGAGAILLAAHQPRADGGHLG